MIPHGYCIVCECGTKIPFSYAQAGSKIACECGATKVVPGLAELRGLVPKDPAVWEAVQPYNDPEATRTEAAVPGYLRYPSSSFLALVIAVAVTCASWLAATVLTWFAITIGAVALFGVMVFFRTGVLTSMLIAFVAWSHVGVVAFAILSGGVYEGPEQYPIVLFVWCAVWPLGLLHGLLFGAWTKRIL
jgi:hypothetical protein